LRLARSQRQSVISSGKVIDPGFAWATLPNSHSNDASGPVKPLPASRAAVMPSAPLSA